jgi:putative endonuclease
MAFYCYILECSDGSYYTGWSTDPKRRLIQHNRGAGARYTRSRRPVRLVYVEELPDKVAALKRERAIKALKRPKKQELIKNNVLQVQMDEPGSLKKSTPER